MEKYNKSSKYNYYYKKSTESILYSDGDQVEESIFNIIKNTKDKSVLSDELNKKIKDWPTEYHFSKSRHCLIRPLSIEQKDSILELGCGCGAITRYLGEIGADVDSVEGTHSRAKIAGERCADLKNVTIYVDDLLRFQTTKKYDWVLLIGVLEYAPIFSNKIDAIQDYLKEAKKHLKPNGKLVIAIENKLGLKYFNGCIEDHVNQAYFGIENRYTEKTPITFGKKELKNELKLAEFSEIEFYFPFPDYKLPDFIVHESAFKGKNFIVSDVLRGLHSRDYSGKKLRAFEESYVWPELESNDLLQQMSNSFLVIAGNKIRKKGNTFSWYFNVNRLAKFTTATEFYLEGNETRIKKEPLLNTKVNSESKVLLNVLNDKYYIDDSMQKKIEIIWHKNGNENDILNIYRIWFEYVLSESDHNEIKNNKKITLSGHLIDLTPFNIKMVGETIHPFDQEWQYEDRILFSWVIFRGLYWSISKLNSVREGHFNTYDIAKFLFEEINLTINNTEINEIQQLEEHFLFLTTGERVKIDFKKWIDKYPMRYEDLSVINSELNYKINNQEENFLELNNLKANIIELKKNIHDLERVISLVNLNLDQYVNSFPVKMFNKFKRTLRLRNEKS